MALPSAAIINESPLNNNQQLRNDTMCSGTVMYSFRLPITGPDSRTRRQRGIAGDV